MTLWKVGLYLSQREPRGGSRVLTQASGAVAERGLGWDSPDLNTAA